MWLVDVVILVAYLLAVAPVAVLLVRDAAAGARPGAGPPARRRSTPSRSPRCGPATTTTSW